MNFINEDEDDLKGKKITINDEQNDAATSSIRSPEEPKSNAVNNFINGFKNFLRPKITSTEIEKDNVKKDSENDINNTTQITNVSDSSPDEKKEETCKDKIANKIIETVEVERNLGVFIALISIGSIVLCFSLFLIPFIITSPRKFSFCFAMGSIFILMSFLFLVGTKKFVTKLFENKRLVISFVFVLSILIGIIFSLGSHYFLSLLCSGIEFISLIMLILTFIPGGRVGINCIKRTLASPFTKLFIKKAKSDLNNL